MPASAFLRAACSAALFLKVGFESARPTAPLLSEPRTSPLSGFLSLMTDLERS